MRQVQHHTGTRSLATVHRHLLKLQQAGLVDWQHNQQWTLHPTARAVPISTITMKEN